MFSCDSERFTSKGDTMETALQLSHITKIFGKIAANNDISLTVKKAPSTVF